MFDPFAWLEEIDPGMGRIANELALCPGKHMLLIRCF